MLVFAVAVSDKLPVRVNKSFPLDGLVERSKLIVPPLVVLVELNVRLFKVSVPTEPVVLLGPGAMTPPKVLEVVPPTVTVPPPAPIVPVPAKVGATLV